MAEDKKEKVQEPVLVDDSDKEQSKEVSEVVHESFIAEQFQGPIPPPSVLRGYEEISPGFAKRIIAMAESETKHRQAMERKVLDAEIQGQTFEAQDTKRGQYCGLVIGIVAILTGGLCGLTGAEWTGSFIGAGGVVGLVSAFVIGRRQGLNEKNSNSSDSSSQTSEKA